MVLSISLNLDVVSTLAYPFNRSDNLRRLLIAQQINAFVLIILCLIPIIFVI